MFILFIAREYLAHLLDRLILRLFHIDLPTYLPEDIEPLILVPGLYLPPLTMSISSLKGLLSSYSPISEYSPDLEKEYQLPLQHDTSSDLESSPGQSRSSAPEKKESRIFDGRTVSDAIIGLSDGMTVPFALTAGLSALGDTKVVVFGGLAELIAGAISMGLGGYLGAKSEE